jgi:hypothetical protein
MESFLMLGHRYSSQDLISKGGVADLDLRVHEYMCTNGSTTLALAKTPPKMNCGRYQNS